MRTASGNSSNFKEGASALTAAGAVVSFTAAGAGVAGATVCALAAIAPKTKIDADRITFFHNNNFYSVGNLFSIGLPKNENQHKKQLIRNFQKVPNFNPSKNRGALPQIEENQL